MNVLGQGGGENYTQSRILEEIRNQNKAPIILHYVGSITYVVRDPYTTKNGSFYDCMEVNETASFTTFKRKGLPTTQDPYNVNTLINLFA